MFLLVTFTGLLKPWACVSSLLNACGAGIGIHGGCSYGRTCVISVLLVLTITGNLCCQDSGTAGLGGKKDQR